MSQLCQHCATPYAEDAGVDGFCCAGCREVYALIQDEGLGDYYRWQDRAAQPLKDRVLAAVDAAAFRRVQAGIEARAAPARAAFKVEGMSCMGCAWLIERLAAKQPGLLEAECGLAAHSVRLRWRADGFDLAAFAAELYRFGYRLEGEPLRSPGTPRLSALKLRLLLASVFTGNALLLAAYAQFVGRSTLVNLLSLLCFGFTLLLGAAPFVLAAYRAAQIRRWHSDWIPVLLLGACMLIFGYRVVFAGMGFSMAASLVSLAVTILLAARVVARRPDFGRSHQTPPPQGGTPT